MTTLTLPNQTEILIVGAGPTGLAAALSLQKQGCEDLLVVDSIASGENTSRALVVHAATLDALDEIGCAEPLAALGIKTTSQKLWDGYKFHDLADFSVLSGHTKFPTLLLVPQNITERVLGEKATATGIKICRPFKVVDVKVNEKNSEYSDVVFENGQVVRARYVIGADGAHSTVRQAAGISYADPDGDHGPKDDLQQAVVADVTFKTSPPVGRTETLFIFANGNVFLILPLPPAAYDGKEVWRMAIGHPVGVPPHAPPTEYLQELVDTYGPNTIPKSVLGDQEPLRIKETVWSSRFRTESAISSTHFKRMRGTSGEGGVAIIVGDAAHKHPPAGGQGMNLGLRDAVSLGPILATHLRERTHLMSPNINRSTVDAPLKAWADVRHEHALAVIRLVKGIMSAAGYKDQVTWYYGLIPINWVRVRNFVLWLGDVTGRTKTTTPWKVSGLLNP